MMRLLILAAGITLGAILSHATRRYAPAILWWAFSRGDRP